MYGNITDPVDAEFVETNSNPSRLSKNSIAVLEQSPPLAAAQSPMLALIAKAVEGGASIDVIGKLMDYQDRYDEKQAKKAFNSALANVKAKMTPITKGQLVDFTGKNSGARTNYRYEDLAGIAAVVDPLLAAEGMGYRYRTVVTQGIVTVTCILFHRDGHNEENTLPASPDQSGNKNSIQAIGSTVTYLERYTLKASLGIAVSNDDDGVASGDRVPDYVDQRGAPVEQKTAVGPISEQQAANISDLLAQKNATGQRLLAFFQIDDFKFLPTDKYATAVQMIKQFKPGAK